MTRDTDQVTTVTMTLPNTATLVSSKRLDWRVEWLPVVFSDESKFCLYVSDRWTRLRRRPGERHLPESIRLRNTDLAPGFRVWGINRYNSRSHFVFLQDKVTNASCIAHVINPVLLLFLRQEGDVLFQQDSASPHTAAVTQRTIRCVKLPMSTTSTDITKIEHIWDFFSRTSTTTIAELRKKKRFFRSPAPPTGYFGHGAHTPGSFSMFL